MSKLPSKVVIATIALSFLLLVGGVAVLFLLFYQADEEYPNGVVVEGVGRCGTTTWLQRGRSIRIERYRCLVTADTDNDVFVWYIRKGYTPTNGGLLLSEIGEGVIPIINVKRIYMINQKDGTTMIRIYDDTTVRAP